MEFCPHCGKPRQEWARFCGSCGKPYDGPTATESAPPVAAPVSAQMPQRDMAAGLMEVERLRAWLVAFRIAGLAIGLAAWWLLWQATGNFYVMVSAPLWAFGGIYAGGLVGLSAR